jgi:hypothetical protein
LFISCNHAPGKFRGSLVGVAVGIGQRRRQSCFAESVGHGVASDPPGGQGLSLRGCVNESGSRVGRCRRFGRIRLPRCVLSSAESHDSADRDYHQCEERTDPDQRPGRDLGWHVAPPSWVFSHLRPGNHRGQKIDSKSSPEPFNVPVSRKRSRDSCGDRESPRRPPHGPPVL